MRYRNLFAVLSLVIASLFVQGQAAAGIFYMRSGAEGQPWDETQNEQAMDAVFGAGIWDDLRYETVNPLIAFSASNSFAFLEGGDDNADELEAFLSANIGLIESWVDSGGRLFLNAAPNEGDGMSFGFGGVVLNFDNSTTFSPEVVAVNGSHPIFNGPFTPITTSFTGDFFGHATISGPGLTSLINRVTEMDSVLAEKDYGLGHVIFGGMTTTNFHEPQPEAFNLRANILAYGANQAVNPVPEPSSIILLCTGGLALALGHAVRRRKRNLGTPA